MGAFGKIAVALALTFISQVQCLISCVAQPCPLAVHDSAPCHHKHKGSAGETAACPQEILAVAPAPAPQAVTTDVLTGVFLPFDSKAKHALAASQEQVSDSSPSPPGSTLFVLRI